MTTKTNAEYRAEFKAKRLAEMEKSPLASILLDVPGAQRQGELTVQPTLDSMTLAELAAHREAVEQAITRAVRQMRSAPPGEMWRRSSWTDIGRHLGITRQAAQQRYGY